MAKHWAKINEAGAVGGMRFMAWVYRHLGRVAFNIALVPVMVFYYFRRGVARRASWDYLSRVKRQYPGALPNRPIWYLSFFHLLEFGHSVLQKMLAWTDEIPTVAMDPDEQTELFDVVDQGVGCLLVGSHFGNIEYSRGISRRHPDLVINVLLHDKHASKFAELMEGAEPLSRMHLIQVTDLDLALTLRLKEKIDQGEWVIIAGDRVPVDEDAKTTSAEFLGDKAGFPIGPYVLGAVLQCPVYLLHCYRVNNEHFLGFEQFSQRLQMPRKDRPAYLQSVAQKYAHALERQLVRSPLQWFNFYDFWNDRTHDASEPAIEQKND
ncbi:MAG TPA: hypothetical protein VJ984_13665 [Xanthomonadales bacterium]|nr:hypothetical protein [Xanthomonadales bacterium]